MKAGLTVAPHGRVMAFGGKRDQLEEGPQYCTDKSYSHCGRHAKYVVVLIGLIAVGCSSGAKAITAMEPRFNMAFCKRRVLHNYEAPLNDLPPVRGLAKTGRLPFGPSSLRMLSPWGAAQKLLVGRGAVKYRLINTDTHDTELGWTVKLSISRVGLATEGNRVVGETTTQIEDVAASRELDLTSTGVSKLGSYRVDVTISGQEAQILGGFSEYFRLVPRHFNVALGINRPSVSPGGILYTRVENVGTEPVLYDRWEWRFENFSGGRWHRVSVARVRARSSTLPGTYVASAGMAEACIGFQLDRNAPPGRYRITKMIGRLDDDLKLIKQVRAKVEFRVLRKRRSH